MTDAARVCTIPGTNPELWFAPEGSREQAEAVRLCGTCPFRAECAVSGLSEEFGVWGGTTPRSLARVRAIKRRQREELLAERKRTRARIVAMTQEGFSKSEIMAELGVSRASVIRARNGYSGSMFNTTAA